ncbi:hypothetical protein [Bradyrhizobium oligotrophicum]|uniref:hypothetical protein n=1 Tax=Bradyrhizobium oligotrophicum TaxID=44255 RepID=UPI003EB70F00
MSVYVEPTTGWLQNPHYPECEEYVDDRGQHIAAVEDFGYACYPRAYNPKDQRWERGGAYQDRVEAKLWAERVAGIHPTKPGDERPPFYYSLLPPGEQQ